jgi:hypothetical protein
MAWAPPEAAAWVPPEVSAPPDTGTGTDAVDALFPGMSAAAGLGRTVVAGTAGMAGKVAGRVADVLPGGADWHPGQERKADTWGAAAANMVPEVGPKGQAVEQAIGEAGQTAGELVDKIPGVNTPAGQTLKEVVPEVAQDIGLAGGAVGGARALARAGAETSTIKRFGGRTEPTAPAAPGPYTIADFAPKPPAAAPAGQPTTAAPEAPPPRVPVLGIRPKAQPAPTAAAAAERIRAQEGPMGVAGAEPATPVSENAPPTPQSARAPSAAPDHAGNAPPDTHDPGFFPAPDNQGLKSDTVGPREQLTRQAAVERGAPTLPQVRDSAITNNYNDQGRDWTGRQAGDPAAVAQTATEAQALHTEAGRISGETGGQLGTGESASTVRGRTYQDWHDTTVNALTKHIDDAYASEDAAAKQIATPGANLRGVLSNDSLIDSANAVQVRSSTHALARNMGVDLTNTNANATMNAYQVEQLRKHAGSVYSNAPRLAQAIKDAADADLPTGAYVRARALNQVKRQMFDNRDGINQLGPSKDIDPETQQPRPENRTVKAPDVMNKIENMDPGQVRHIMGTMKRSATVLDRLGDHEAAQSVAKKALRAAQQLQSHLTERWIDEAGKGGGWNQRRAHQFLRNNQETLAATMSDEQMHQIRNVSNAANVLDLDKGYKGAFAQFRSGASWLRQRIGRTIEGMITDAIPFGNTIGEMTGLSEKGRDILGGANKAETPKNFTRPLGAKIPGQRGAVGLLNPPGIVHEHDPETGWHTVTSPNGMTMGKDTANGNIQVSRTDTHPEAQGGGEGTQRMMRLADVAHERGGNLISDHSVSTSAQGVYSAMKRAGYDVQKNPNAVEKAGRSVSDSIDRPVMTVGPRPLGAVPQAGAIPGEKLPLGRTIFGGRQAGAVGGDLRRPKAEAPLAGAPEGDRPNAVARGAATRYMKSAGMDYKPLTDYRYVPPEVATDVANAYDAMKHDPTNPKVKAAYDAFKAETLAQYKQMTAGKNGLKVTLDKNYPYSAPREVHEDVRNNNHMSVFPTELGFGESSPTVSGDDVVKHIQNTQGRGSKISAVEARSLAGLDAGGDYKRVDYPINQLKMDKSELQPGTAQEYAKHKTPFPAITLDSDGNIRDGNNRVEAARLRGDTTIPTHVPIDTTTGKMAADAAPMNDHPMLEKSPIQMGGKDATYNDLFRATHDYYGHIANGNGFRANGEYNAWRAHRQMYSAAAQPAMDAETLGQNSWVNNGPHAAANKGATAADTVYAEQKAGLLPPKVVKAAVPGVSADERHVTNLLTDQERGQLRTDTTKRLVDAFHGAPATEEYAAAALAGSAKRGWYRNSAEAISNVLGIDAPRFSALLSSMSPQVSVQTNFSNALKTFINWDKAGRPTSPAAIRQIMEDSSQRSPTNKGNSNVLDAWFHNGVRALTAEDPTNVKLSGPKVHSFYSNLNDHVNEVTNDAWMAAFAKIDPAKLGGSLNASGPGKSASYLALSARVRDAARMLSNMTGETWTPREVQETVWSWAKAAYEHAEETGDRSIPELVKNGDITDDLINSTPDFHQLFGTAEHRGFLQSSRYAGNAERMAGWKSQGANTAHTGKASAFAAQTLRPHLVSAAERLEALRQERNAAAPGEEAPF